jgi:hypothetical protein
MRGVDMAQTVLGRASRWLIGRLHRFTILPRTESRWPPGKKSEHKTDSVKRQFPDMKILCRGCGAIGLDAG